jgi:hypothetical protein
VPTVTDTDLCHVTDAGEALAVPTILVTGISVGDGAGAPAQGMVVFDSGQLEVSPGTGIPAAVFENPAVQQVYQGVMVPVSLPDSQLAFAAAFTYTITLKIEGFSDLVFSGVQISRSRFPSGTCDLSQLV